MSKVNRMVKIPCAVMLTALMLSVASSELRAQIPGAATGATGATAATGATGAAAGAAQGGFLAKCCAAIEECKRKCCKTPLGQMINSMLSPASAFTGGVVPGFCPTTVSDKQLEEPGVAGAAAAAKKEAMEAKARREAVRFLGTVDCRYFPGVAQQLATALRVDSSECVRFEAALVLGHGCCCSEITIKALEASVSGIELDGNPAERSPRVRCAAAIALERCLSCYMPPYVEPEPVKKPEVKPIKTGEVPGPTGEVDPGDKAKEEKEKKDKPDALPAPKPVGDGTQKVQSRPPSKETVERARKVLAEFNTMLATAAGGVPTPPPGAVAGRKGLFHLIKDSEFEGPLVYTPLEPSAPGNAMTEPPSFLPPPSFTAAPVIQGAPSVPTTMPTAPAAKLVAPKPAAPVEMPVSVVSPSPVKPTFLAPVPPAAPAIAPPTPAPKPIVVQEPTKTSAAAPMMTSEKPTAKYIPTTPEGNTKLVPTSMTVKAPSNSETVVDWCRRVLEGATPGERHAAIRQVVQFPWLEHPVIASTLLAGAKEDSSSVVRVDCIRHLAAYRMNHPQVVVDLGTLTSDKDTWVRQEAVKAVEQLKSVK